MSKETRDTVPELYKCVCGGTAYIHLGENGYSVRCELDPGLASVPTFPKRKKAIRMWNKAQDEMEPSTVCVVKAYHARKSYGQFMASMLDAAPVVRYPKKETAPADPVLELRCIQCGMLIPAEIRSKKYCSEICATHYREKQRRIRAKLAGENLPNLEPKRRCALCGVPISPDSNRYKYCSDGCAQKAMQIQCREYRKRRRTERR